MDLRRARGYFADLVCLRWLSLDLSAGRTADASRAVSSTTIPTLPGKVRLEVTGGNAKGFAYTLMGGRQLTFNDGLQPLVPFFQRQLDLQQMSITFTADTARLFRRQRFKQRKGDIHRLIIFRLGT